MFGAHPELRSALGSFVEQEGELSLLAGNHDAELGAAGAEAELAELLDLHGDARARLTVGPWFLRRDGVHVEHGHLYDPDNAPGHPLVVGARPLGVHFSAEFIHPTNAHRYLQANDGTPLNLFLSAFRWYGPRAPGVVLQYFRAAFGALHKAGPFYRGLEERGLGEERMAQFAEDAGVPRACVEAVLGARAPSTLESFSDTFARLYLDRVVATVAVGAGLVGLGLTMGRGARGLGDGERGDGEGGDGGGARSMAVGSLALGATLLVASWVNGHDRYRGTVVERLAAAARQLVATAGARYVVFGHTHREVLTDTYANTGSFAWPAEAPGRPYLELCASGRVERRYAARS